MKIAQVCVCGAAYVVDDGNTEPVIIAGVKNRLSATELVDQWDEFHRCPADFKDILVAARAAVKDPSEQAILDLRATLISYEGADPVNGQEI